MVNSDIFKPMPLQGTGEAERERLAREAARVLCLLHGDSITPSPSPECTPLLPMHSTLRLPPPVLEAPGQQQQQQQQQQPQAVPQQQQAATVPQQPGGWLWQSQVTPQVQVPPMAQKPVDSTAAAAPKPLPLERLESSALTSIPRNVWGGSSSSSGGSGGSRGSSSDWGQVSSGGSESSGGCEASGACSDGGAAALLALCSIAKQPEIQSACMKPAPAVQQPGEQQQQQAKPKLRPPRAQQQAQRAQHKQAQQAQQTQRAARKPRKPRNPVASDSGSESKSAAAAAKLGVKRGSLARPAPASSPAAKRARAAPAVSKASAAPACKLAARTAGKAAAGSSKGPGKPEPKRALSIELLEAEVRSSGCVILSDASLTHLHACITPLNAPCILAAPLPAWQCLRARTSLDSVPAGEWLRDGIWSSEPHLDLHSTPGPPLCPLPLPTGLLRHAAGQGRRTHGLWQNLVQGGATNGGAERIARKAALCMGLSFHCAAHVPQ